MRSGDINAFIHDLDYTDLPADVAKQARRCLTDLIAVAAAGSITGMSQLLRDHAAQHLRGGDRQARLLFDGRAVSPVGAALANAGTIDAMDGHEGHRLAKGHAAAAVLPAAMALLDGSPNATGHGLLSMLVAGYEVAARAGVALHASAGDYHSSGSWNCLGAAAAGARALGLDAAATGHALGIAEYHGPRGPMMRCIEHPTMVKDSSAIGAQTGVSAALLAADGFTGGPATLVTAHQEAWHDLGQRWAILEQYLKPYPVCRWAQPAVNGALRVVSATDLHPRDIARITVTTFDPATSLTTSAPTTTEEAQYSLRFPVALAAVHRQLIPDMVGNPERAGDHVLRLATGMEIIESAEMTAAFPAARLADVSIVLADGCHFSSGPTAAPGDPDQQLDSEALRAKFLSWSGPAIGDHRAQRLYASLATVVDRPLADLTVDLYLPGSGRS